MKTTLNVIILLTTIISGCATEKANEIRPNILWICCEDITTMLGCYGDNNAKTPNLDAFASRSIRFTNAFATAPVCAPSRSCIITGYHAITLGTQHLRSEVKIPNELVPFPRYLNKLGYYTSNNGKEDYNFIDTGIWDEFSAKAHWRNRSGDQPFFSVFNLGITHQSKIFGDDSIYQERIADFIGEINPLDPDSLDLPPYYPDSPEIRELWSRYYTNVEIMDLQFADIMNQLKEDHLEDNTIVFFYSDHGTGMPRSKRALYDSGLKIPLLIYIPEKYAEEYGFTGASIDERMVSFLDFAPSALEIAGADLPNGMKGLPILSTGPMKENPYVFSYSDRVDEAFEMARSIRTARYRYIRNFMSHLPLLQPNYYTDKSEIMFELEKFRNNPENSPYQAALFRSSRAPEELYDLVADPYEVNNLASDPGYESVLLSMRDTLVTEMMKSFDTGLMPEPDMTILSSGSTPFQITRDEDCFPVGQILDACNLVLEPELRIDTTLQYLLHENRFVRYWTLIGIQVTDNTSFQILKEVRNMLADDSPTVSLEAAMVLIKNGQSEALQTIIKHLGSNDETVVLYAARAFELICPLLSEIPEEVRDIYKRLEEETSGQWFGHKLYAFWAMSEAFL